MKRCFFYSEELLMDITMKYKILLFGLLLVFSNSVFSQPNRITYNKQQLFLSGANLAWINFAGDIGPVVTDFNSFADIMLQMHDHGGNVLRWWLHTNGTVTPAFNSSNFVTGPGSGTISELKQVLDLAWQREIGINLSLWSFDMLRSSNSTTVLNRNRLMLTDTAYTNAYINNCLIPMIDSLRGHPAIVDWEIFNEAEGMSNEFGWTGIDHVAMSDIQRFVNLCSGAIHRSDPTAKVTTGVWSFQALTDITTLSRKENLNPLSASQKSELETFFFQKYRLSLSADEITNYLQKIAGTQNFNYYSDLRLINAGGDPDGILDFYSVHYYVALGSQFSPFINTASHWNLSKPIVIAEFAMQTNDGVTQDQLFNRIYQTGYAGALPWSWTDPTFSSQANMLAGMQFMWNNYRKDVDVLGIGGDWPLISIISPDTNAVFPDSAAVPILTTAVDSDGYVAKVEFFANDSLIGVKDSVPFSFTWSNIPPNHYLLTAIAIDNQGHQRTSNIVPITVGIPPMKRFEAENAIRQGNMSVKSDPTASGGAYLDIPTQSGTVTWNISGVTAAGNYPIKFGYKLPYATPKQQYLNVNGVRVDTLAFTGNTSTWGELAANINLLQGNNVIQMELFWGWMYLDYLAVPASILTAVEGSKQIPFSFSLEQNYPNPFNPITTIRYSIANSGLVKLFVYDILGREIAGLVNQQQQGGFHDVSFNAGSFASGVYFYRLEAGNQTEIKKMIVLK
jgi:predicted GNAT superfamily acetyltransferase